MNQRTVAAIGDSLLMCPELLVDVENVAVGTFAKLVVVSVMWVTYSIDNDMCFSRYVTKHYTIRFIVVILISISDNVYI